MADKPPKDQYITARVDKATKEKLKSWAIRDRRTVTNLVSNIVEDAVNKERGRASS